MDLRSSLTVFGIMMRTAKPFATTTTIPTSLLGAIRATIVLPPSPKKLLLLIT
jgi:hypothetical protein